MGVEIVFFSVGSSADAIVLLAVGWMHDPTVRRGLGQICCRLSLPSLRQGIYTIHVVLLLFISISLFFAIYFLFIFWVHGLSKEMYVELMRG